LSSDLLMGLAVAAGLVSAGVAIVGYANRSGLQMAMGLAGLFIILAFVALGLYVMFECRLPDCHAP
jgi:hypothetical protein